MGNHLSVLKILKYQILKMDTTGNEKIENILNDMIDLNMESRWRLEKLKISLDKSQKENEELRRKNIKLEEKCREYLRNIRYLEKKTCDNTINFDGISFYINESENLK